MLSSAVSTNTRLLPGEVYRFANAVFMPFSFKSGLVALLTWDGSALHVTERLAVHSQSIQSLVWLRSVAGNALLASAARDKQFCVWDTSQSTYDVQPCCVVVLIVQVVVALQSIGGCSPRPRSTSAHPASGIPGTKCG